MKKNYRILYNVSAFFPIYLLGLFNMFIEDKINTVLFYVVLALFVLSVGLGILVLKIQNKIHPIDYSFSVISIKESESFEYLLACAIPLVADIDIMVISTFFLYLIYIILSKVILPNPFLWLLGYRIYSATTLDGIENIILVSKNEFESMPEKVKCSQLFYGFLIDKGGPYE